MRVALWNDSVKSAKLLVLFCHLATFLAIARLLWGTRDGPYLGLWFRFTEVFLINALAFQRHSVAWYVATYSRLTYHECIQDPAPDRYLFLGLNPKACSPDRMNQWMEWSFSMDVQTKPNFSQCSWIVTVFPNIRIRTPYINQQVVDCCSIVLWLSPIPAVFLVFELLAKSRKRRTCTNKAGGREGWSPFQLVSQFFL